jgi:putative (di)nucleoside polyphosphate hydrolase
MIDTDGYRPNVGIILANTEGKVLWARRVGNQDAWQFPQGGIQHGEEPEAALYRELKEEVGLQPADVSILACTQGWLRYRLPERLIRPRADGQLCIGQKQKWFFLRLRAADDKVRLDNNGDEAPEFDHWEWVSYWYPVDKVVSFKRDVYRKALKELAPYHHRSFLS